MAARSLSEPVTAFQFLCALRPAIPMSIERPCTVASNGELKRWMLNRAVLLNRVAVLPDEAIEFPVDHLVFFPNSTNRRTTVI